jgi:hypothetical protein
LFVAHHYLGTWGAVYVPNGCVCLIRDTRAGEQKEYGQRKAGKLGVGSCAALAGRVCREAVGQEEAGAAHRVWENLIDSIALRLFV